MPNYLISLGTWLLWACCREANYIRNGGLCNHVCGKRH